MRATGSHTPRGIIATAALRLCAALAAAAFGAALASCGRGGGPPHDNLTIALAVFPSEAARYRVFARDFEHQTGAHVAIVAQSYSDILRVLEAESRAGRGGLDLVELDLAMLGRVRGAVVNLDDTVTPAARAMFPDAAWRAATFNGHVRFVPHRLMWQAMIYNRVEVPDPPATWDQLADFARCHPGKVVLKAARYEGAICDVMPLVWSAGGGELEPESAGSLRAFGFLSGLAPYLNAESAVFREMSVLEAQARGSVWIHFNWPFAMGYLASKGLAPQIDASAPIPAGPGGPATVLGGGYLAIPTSAPHPALARRFLAYLLQPQVQRQLGRTLGWYGSVAPAAGSKEAALYAGFSAMRDYVRARPTVDCYAQLSNAWQRAIRGVLFRGEAPRTALRGVTESGATRVNSNPACACD
jgi:ABC-type glycerol-3-phosphate transport system substrate-binding protein